MNSLRGVVVWMSAHLLDSQIINKISVINNILNTHGVDVDHTYNQTLVLPNNCINDDHGNISPVFWFQELVQPTKKYSGAHPAENPGQLLVDSWKKGVDKIGIGRLVMRQKEYN